jgi:hypothetical protein
LVVQVEWSLGAQLFFATEDSRSFHLAPDPSADANSCVIPDAGHDDDPPSCFGVGTLVGLCFLNIVIGATLSQLCKIKQPRAGSFSGGDSEEGIYAGSRPTAEQGVLPGGAS